MKKFILIFLLPLSLVAAELYPPRIKLLELSIDLKKNDKAVLSKWSQNEFWKYRLQASKRMESQMALTLYRMTAKEEDFSATFIKAISNQSEPFKNDINLLKPVTAILQKLQKSDLNGKRLTWYFYDYLCKCQPKNKEYEKIRDSLPQGNWTHILTGYHYRFDVGEALSHSPPDKITDKIIEAEGYGNNARKIQKKIAKVNGLIVITLRNGRKTGMAAEITALPLSNPEKGGRAYIDQRVGMDMKRSVDNAMMALQKRYPLVASNQNIVFSFDERESMKDGNSAGVAFTLLLYSLYEGINIDPTVAVTGVILPDCGVKAVGGVPSKIRGAWRKGLKLAVIPEENIDIVKDLTLIYELPILWNIQIFTAKHFTEVLPIATVEKNSQVKKAIAKFNALTKILNKGNKEIISNKAHIVKELDEILKLTPNHESARVLKMMLTGKRPKTLSLNGSVDFLFMMIERTLSITPSKAYETAEEMLVHNRKFLSSSLRKISPLAHPFAAEIRKYIDSLMKYRRLLVLNIHKDKTNIGTALNMMESESKAMDKTRERLQKSWEKLQKKL
jgi:hypothetical protein